MATVKALLDDATLKLLQSGVVSARLDTRLLLQQATGFSHAEIIADAERDVPEAQVQTFAAMIARREAREPVTRILGSREFYGRDFAVTTDVLDPRADTETLVDACQTVFMDEKPQRILDLGTGSGILAITLLAEWPKATGVAVDVSPAALMVAQANAATLGVSARLEFLQGCWFQPVQGLFDLVVSNPPYIPAEDIALLDPEVRVHDPMLALLGGADGLDCYRQIARDAGKFLAPCGKVVLEIGAGQADAITLLFSAHGFSLELQRADLGGHVRCLVFRIGG
jgi:release factor glutamine methyltransferase